MLLFMGTLPVHTFGETVRFSINFTPAKIEFRMPHDRKIVDLPRIGQCVGELGLELHRCGEFEYSFVKSIPMCLCVFYGEDQFIAYAPQYDDCPSANLITNKINHLLEYDIFGSSANSRDISFYTCDGEILCPSSYFASLSDIDVHLSDEMKLTIVTYSPRRIVNVVFHMSDGRTIYLCVEFDCLENPRPRLQYDRKDDRPAITVSNIGESVLATFVSSGFEEKMKLYSQGGAIGTVVTSTPVHTTYSIRMETDERNYLEVSVRQELNRAPPQMVVLLLTDLSGDEIETAIMVTLPPEIALDEETVHKTLSLKAPILRTVYDLRTILGTADIPSPSRDSDFGPAKLSFLRNGIMTVECDDWTAGNALIICNCSAISLNGTVVRRQIRLTIQIECDSFQIQEKMRTIKIGISSEGRFSGECIIPKSLLFPVGNENIMIIPENSAIEMETMLSIGYCNVTTIRDARPSSGACGCSSVPGEFLRLKISETPVAIECSGIGPKESNGRTTILHCHEKITLIPVLWDRPSPNRSFSKLPMLTGTVSSPPQSPGTHLAYSEDCAYVGLGYNVIPFASEILFFQIVVDETSEMYIFPPNANFRLANMLTIRAQKNTIILDVDPMNATPLPQLRLKFADSTKLVSFIATVLPGTDHIHAFYGMSVPIMLTDNDYNPSGVQLTTEYRVNGAVSNTLSLDMREISIHGNSAGHVDIAPRSRGHSGSDFDQIMMDGMVEAIFTDRRGTHRGNVPIVVTAGEIPVFPAKFTYVKLSDMSVWSGSIWNGASPMFPIAEILFRNRRYDSGDVIYFNGGMIVINSHGEFTVSRNLATTACPGLTDISCFGGNNMSQDSSAVLSIQGQLVEAGPFFARVAPGTTTRFSLDLPLGIAISGYRLFRGSAAYIDCGAKLHQGQNSFVCTGAGKCTYVSENESSQIIVMKLAKGNILRMCFLYIRSCDHRTASFGKSYVTHSGQLQLSPGMKIDKIVLGTGSFADGDGDGNFYAESEEGSIFVESDGNYYASLIFPMSTTMTFVIATLDRHGKQMFVTKMETLEKPSCRNNIIFMDATGPELSMSRSDGRIDNSGLSRRASGWRSSSPPADSQRDIQRLSMSFSQSPPIENLRSPDRNRAPENFQSGDFSADLALSPTFDNIRQVDSMPVAISLSPPMYFAEPLAEVPTPGQARNFFEPETDQMEDYFGSKTRQTEDFSEPKPTGNSTGSGQGEDYFGPQQGGNSVGFGQGGDYFGPKQGGNFFESEPTEDYFGKQTGNSAESEQGGNFFGSNSAVPRYNDDFGPNSVPETIHSGHFFESEARPSGGFFESILEDSPAVENFGPEFIGPKELSIMGLVGLEVSVNAMRRQFSRENNISPDLQNPQVIEKVRILTRDAPIGVRMADDFTFYFVITGATMKKDFENCDAEILFSVGGTTYAHQMEIYVTKISQIPRTISLGALSIVNFLTAPTMKPISPVTIVDDLDHVDIRHMADDEMDPPFRMKFDIVGTLGLPEIIVLDLSKLELWCTRKTRLEMEVSIKERRPKQLSETLSNHAPNPMAVPPPTRTMTAAMTTSRRSFAPPARPHVEEFVRQQQQYVPERTANRGPPAARQSFFEDPEPSFRAPTGQAPASFFEDPEPSFRAPTGQAPASFFEDPEPSFRAPTGQAPTPSFQQGSASQVGQSRVSFFNEGPVGQPQASFFGEPVQQPRQEPTRQQNSRNVLPQNSRSFRDHATSIQPPLTLRSDMTGTRTRGGRNFTPENPIPTITLTPVVAPTKQSILLMIAKSGKQPNIKIVHTHVRMNFTGHADCKCSDNLRIVAVPGGIVFVGIGTYAINGQYYRATEHPGFRVPIGVEGRIVPYVTRFTINVVGATEAVIFAQGEDNPIYASISQSMSVPITNFIDLSSFRPGISILLQNASVILGLYYIV